MEERFGFLLLTSHLGNPQRRPLTTAQLRVLTQRVRAQNGGKSDRELTEADLLALGYSREAAAHIRDLLEDRALLERYLQKAAARRCVPITRQDDRYPAAVRRKLGLDSPGCLWAKGDLSLLKEPMLSAVGCRELLAANRRFAEEVGLQAARQGYTLVSGNAIGADKAAQDSCLAAGGRVISIVPDALHSHLEQPRVLLLSEEDYDMPFSTLRALRRNRVIHTLGQMAFVSQCRLERGGTWNGTAQNLHCRWTPVYVHRDGSDAAAALERLGAELIDLPVLSDLRKLPRPGHSLLEIGNNL